MKFTYIATNQAKETVKGTVEASDRSTALKLLSDRRLKPVSIEELQENKGSINIPGFSKNSTKVKTADLVMFTRQLSAMVSAGVPLLRAIESLETHADSPGIKSVSGAIYKEVQSGSQLADALEKHPAVFNDIYVNMVRAGEAAGILDDILKRLALQQEKSASMKKKIKSAMTYPMVLIVITVGAFFGLMLFVIPQIAKILQDLGGPDAKLPILTQMMLGLSSFMINYWWIMLLLIGGTIFGLKKYLATRSGKHAFHALVIRIPGVGPIIRKVAVARFARTFSALIGAGVAVLEALNVTSRAMGNLVYEDAIVDAAERVKNGEALSKIIESNKLFPPIVAQMLAVGEETGETAGSLIKIADFYEEEVDAAIEGISSIIEPVMIVFMGGMVGVIAASVMQPISELSSNIKA